MTEIKQRDLIIVLITGQQNPLEVSPANPDVSKERPEQEGGPSNSAAESSNSGRKQSGHGSPQKGKKV
jgi:hypothetical protein